MYCLSIDIHHASDDDNDSDNGVHTLELESEDESDDWVEQESESESESEPQSPQYVEDREGGSIPFQDKDEPSTSTGRSAVKKVQFSGGEVEAPKEVLKEVKEQRLQRAANIAQSRILTQEEFRIIRQTQLSSKLAPRRGVKRQLTELLAQQEERREGEGELLPEAAIMTLDHVKIKYDKKARLESIKSGREDRDKFGTKRHKLNPHSSTTNKDKNKKKAFMMQKQKRLVWGKSKKSFREKQMALGSRCSNRNIENRTIIT